MERRNFIRNASFGGLALTGLAGSVLNIAGCKDQNRTPVSKSSFTNLSGFTPLSLDENPSEFTIKGGAFNYNLKI